MLMKESQILVGKRHYCVTNNHTVGRLAYDLARERRTDVLALRSSHSFVCQALLFLITKALVLYLWVYKWFSVILWMLLDEFPEELNSWMALWHILKQLPSPALVCVYLSHNQEKSGSVYLRSTWTAPRVWSQRCLGAFLLRLAHSFI